MVVKVAGLWELNWNNPLSESWLWSFVLREYAIPEWYMSPVTGIIHNEAYSGNLLLTEKNTFAEILALNQDLPKIYVDEKGSIELQEFEHPDSCLYVFGNAGLSLMRDNLLPGDFSIKIPTLGNSGVLWPHQCLLTVMYDRFIKSQGKKWL